MNKTGHRANEENCILLFLTKLHKSHQSITRCKSSKSVKHDVIPVIPSFRRIT